ncbi:hypothetical protein ACWV95_14520 [Streptomyces albus]
MTTTGNGPAAQTLRGLLATTGAGPAAEAPAQRGTARRAVETAGPARTVAAAVHAAGGVDAPAARRLRELAAQLGDSATRWLGVHDALVRHRGTLPALLAAVPAPAPPAAPGQTRPPEPRSVPATPSPCCWNTRHPRPPPPHWPRCPTGRWSICWPAAPCRDPRSPPGRRTRRHPCACRPRPAPAAGHPGAGPVARHP